LGGNSRTAFICTVTLAARFYEETKSTLTFADRAKKVSCKPQKNIVMDEKAMLTEARDEIDQLKRALKLAAGGGDISGLLGGGGGAETEESKAENEALANKIRFLESMVVGGGGAESLDVLNAMWTPELGQNAFDAASATKMLREAEERRVKEWRDKQAAEIDAVWVKVDTDGNGSLDPTELGSMLGLMGQEMDIETVMAEIDEDGDGEVDKDEFLEWWCTRSVADRERLKGEAAAGVSERMQKLKIKLKLGARIAGSIKRNSARARTVGFAQMTQAMGLRPGGPAGGDGAMSVRRPLRPFWRPF
jgi:hypothetical protein